MNSKCQHTVTRILSREYDGFSNECSAIEWCGHCGAWRDRIKTPKFWNHAHKPRAFRPSDEVQPAKHRVAFVAGKVGYSAIALLPLIADCL